MDCCAVKKLLRRDVGLFVGATDGIAVGRFEGWKLVRFVDLFVGVTDGLQQSIVLSFEGWKLDREVVYFVAATGGLAIGCFLWIGIDCIVGFIL